MIYVGDVVNKREFEHPVKLDFVVVKNILNNRRKNKFASAAQKKIKKKNYCG